MVSMAEGLEQPRKFRAQDRYAQEILTWLWDHPEACERNEDVVFYRGSLHQLVRKLRPSAQAGDVVNILREFGAVASAGHGLWELRRREAFNDDEGRPIDVDVPSYGHDPKYVVLQRNVNDLGQRVIDLESLVSNLTQVVVTLARKVDPTMVMDSPAEAVRELLEGQGHDQE
jgi:hypothetical protein